jgi:UPF0755 protein
MGKGLAAGFLVATGLAMALTLWTAWEVLHRPLQLPDTAYMLDVALGDSLRSVASRLQQDGLLERPAVLVAYGRVTGLAGRIKAGEYEIKSGVTPIDLVRLLVDGKVRLHALTIVEGWTVRDLLRETSRHPAIRRTLPPAVTDELSLATLLDLPGGNAEGWLFPDTYLFARGVSDRELLGIAHERMRQVLDRAWAQRASDLPLRSAYEALILASIVEKESSLAAERPRIAGVFVRRLRMGMKLQTDPSVIYGLGEGFDGNLTRQHLSQDAPYNTYQRAGLPPTPISLPGEASVMAAVRPEDTGALYFVASGRGDGSHVFSRTLEEHNAAVRRYLDVSRSRN